MVMGPSLLYEFGLPLIWLWCQSPFFNCTDHLLASSIIKIKMINYLLQNFLIMTLYDNIRINIINLKYQHANWQAEILSMERKFSFKEINW